jgi:hypothetical protein
MRYLIALLLVANAHASEDLIAEAKEQIGKGLKDPYSAMYEGVYMGQAANGKPVVCGTVNAKNSYGAYGGRKRFYYLPGHTKIDDGQNKDVVLHSFCGANPR